MNCAEKISSWAKWALLEEAQTMPKPGLVDPVSNGSHTDMDFAMFQNSAAALEPYFALMAEQGKTYAADPEKLFQEIRRIGMLAESVMLKATNGVNTHKGAIFTIRILCASAGALIEQKREISVCCWIAMEQDMVRRILMEEVRKLSGQKIMSNGHRNLKQYGSDGVRGEAIRGYPSITEIAIPVLINGVESNKNWNQVKLQALFALMSQVEDGNILSRTGRSGQEDVWKISKEFMKSGGAYGPGALENLRKLDRYFIKMNYSNGGCADLLAGALFMLKVLGEI